MEIALEIIWNRRLEPDNGPVTLVLFQWVSTYIYLTIQGLMKCLSQESRSDIACCWLLCNKFVSVHGVTTSKVVHFIKV